MNLGKKILKIVLNVLTIILFILLALIIYGKLMINFSSNKYPNYFGYTFFEVASGSMMPTLKINDVILVKISKDDIKVDDIIAFRNEKSIITHRVMFIEDNKLVVKGDNNNTVDNPINYDQVIGKVVKIYPKLGLWKKVVTEPKILIAIFVTLLLFDFALSYNNPKKKKDIEKEIKKEEVETKKDSIVEIKMINKPEPTIETEKLLEITKKIDIEEINKMLNNEEQKLNKEEIKNVKEEIKRVEEENDDTIDDNLTDKEKDFLNYTIRLDLNEIKNKIDKKIL